MLILYEKQNSNEEEPAPWGKVAGPDEKDVFRVIRAPKWASAQGAPLCSGRQGTGLCHPLESPVDSTCFQGASRNISLGWKEYELKQSFMV